MADFNAQADPESYPKRQASSKPGSQTKQARGIENHNPIIRIQTFRQGSTTANRCILGLVVIWADRYDRITGGTS